MGGRVILGWGVRGGPQMGEKLTLKGETGSENHGRSFAMPARTWVRQLVASALVSAAAAQLEWTAIPYPENAAQVRNA
jgi:hypothetical protein